MNQEENRKKTKKAAEPKTSYQNRYRILFVFGFMMLIFVLLALRLGNIQIINADMYSQKALKQQTSDSVVAAVRGDILDCNGKQLAISATTSTVWVRPASVKSNGKTDADIEYNARNEAVTLAAILGMDENEVYSTITAEKALLKVKKYVESEIADEVRAAGLCGIEIVEDARRSYPLRTFASHIVGFTNDDNDGQNGLELYYNRYLSGTDGRLITTKDKNTNSLIYGTSKYYDPQDGKTLVTTIDENIQYIVEQRLDEYKSLTGATRMMCIVQDPKTGGIKAMAQTNDYDPNDPRVPMDTKAAANFSSMSDQEKVNYWYKMWRCFCINDTYEPGSTFKLITASIALDAGVVKLTDRFSCSGSIVVSDRTLRCWYYPRAHGSQTLKEAIGNSCNPVMVQVMHKLTRKQYYEGLDSFGITAKTGVDYPGEGSNIIYADGDAGPVELATMSFGQGIAVTPISLITAVSSLANGGYVMQPHFMDKLLNPDGSVYQEFTPTIKSVSVSAQTAAEMLSVMEYVVSDGGAGSAKIPGYRIAGKTGTASKPVLGGYSDSDFLSSFIGVAPADDPQFTILVLVDTPKGKIYGSQTAAPCAKAIMQDILHYLNIQPQYSEKELKALKSTKTTVPDVSEQGLENAIGVLAGCDLDYELSPKIDGLKSGEIIILDQFPKAGETVNKNSKVILYYEIVNTDNTED